MCERNYDIKLVIFDLDEILWKGKLLENDIQLDDKVVEMILMLKKANIALAIVANTNEEVAKKILEDNDLIECFHSIDVGYRNLRSMVFHRMTLDAYGSSETLFVSNNQLRTSELRWKSANLNIASRDELEEWVRQILSNVVPDKKERIPRKYWQNFPIDHDYTFEQVSRPVVEMDYNAKEYKKEIFYLLDNTSQLNYTKRKETKESFDRMLDRTRYRCGVVRCKTRVNDFGVAGFFCLELKTNRLIHFLFTFEMLGIGIEQYVYALLGFPELAVCGEVAAQLNKYECPFWVNYSRKNKEKIKVLLKGTCDVVQAAFYLDKNMYDFTREESRVNEFGFKLTSVHLATLVNGIRLSPETKTEIALGYPYYLPNLYETTLFSQDHDIAVFSLVNSYARKLYFDKKHKILQDFELLSWDDKIHRGIYSQKMANNGYTFDEYMEQNYELHGYLEPDAFKEYLEIVLSKVKRPVIILNAPELDVPYFYDENYYMHCREINSVVQEVCRKDEKCFLVDVRNHVQSIGQISDMVAHYSRDTYAWIANEIRKHVQTCFY